MYLMALTNFDYIVITMFFAIMAFTAYIFRRQNATSNAFLFASTKVEEHLLLIGSFGLIEIVLLNHAAGVIGLGVIYIIIVAMLIILGLKIKLEKCYAHEGVGSFGGYLVKNLGVATAVLVSVIHLLIFLLLMVLSIEIAYKLLHALMGWNFVNSVLGVSGLIAIYSIIGGIKAAKYNKLSQVLIVLVIAMVALFLAISGVGGVAAIDANLEHLALANNVAANFYTGLVINRYVVASFVLFVIGGGGLYLLTFTRSEEESYIKVNKFVAFSFRTIIAVVFVAIGVIALGSKTPSKIIDGKEIVTIQAQLPDGQTGYVVKAVDANNSSINMIDRAPGIIPPMINEKTGLVENGSYNYNLAGVVMLRKAFTGSLQVLVVIFVFAAFMLSLTTYLFTACRIALHEILLPCRLIDKYGDIGNLWALRIIILSSLVLALIGAFLWLPYFNLQSNVCAIIAIFVAPLFAILFVALLHNKIVSKSYLAIIVGVLLAIIMSITIENSDFLIKYAVIAVASFVITILSGFIIGVLDNK